MILICLEACLPLYLNGSIGAYDKDLIAVIRENFMDRPKFIVRPLTGETFLPPWKDFLDWQMIQSDILSFFANHVGK